MIETRTPTTTQQIEDMKIELDASLKGEVKKYKKKHVHTVLFALMLSILVACALSIFITGATSGTPNLFGLYMFKIESGSMTPTLTEGSVMLATKPGKIEVGDIITFRMGALRNTHRVTKIVYSENGKIVGYITKGDANFAEDSGVVLHSDVIAVYLCRIPLP